MPTDIEIQQAEQNFNLVHTDAERNDVLAKVKLLPPYQEGKNGVQVHQLRAFYPTTPFARLTGMLDKLVELGLLTHSTVPSPNKKVRFSVYTVVGSKS